MEDLRKWLLQSERPPTELLLQRIWHVPSSSFRSRAVMELFLNGFKTDFKLTDRRGQPTETLRLLAKLTKAVLVRYPQLPDDERMALKEPGGPWYLRNITQGVKDLHYRLPWGVRYTIYAQGLFPGLKRLTIKRETRYVSECPSNWSLSDEVYDVLHRWTYGYHNKEGDGYGVLEKLLAAAHGVASDSASAAAPGEASVASEECVHSGQRNAAEEASVPTPG